MLRRLAEKYGLVFAIVFVWKVALLLFTAQPVPNNDAFFYDGPVVNFLLHGQYCNPSLVHALPISGGEVFSAYPPLYQGVLFGWMSLFGTSALAAMWLHVVLLGIYFLIGLAIFRRLQVPALVVNLAGLFLFGITFHDRPDTLAHVLGVLGVCALGREGRWVWLAAGAVLLTFCTSLQIGGVYLLWCCLLAFGNVWSGRSPFPWKAAAGLGLALAGLVVLVRWGFPHLWAGFQEHVRITPSLTEWRWPGLLELLKTARTAPGIFTVAMLMVWSLARRRVSWLDIARTPLGSGTVGVQRASVPLAGRPKWFCPGDAAQHLARQRINLHHYPPLAWLAVSGTLAALAIIGASLVKISPNTVHITNYLQPVVVGAFLGAGIFVRREEKLWRPVVGLFVLLSLVTGVRAIGMTTWGVMCARDFSQRDALVRIRAEVDTLPPRSTVIASSAYLYDLAGRTNLNLIHSDWPAAPGGPDWETHAYAARRPEKIILTQFDFHRRFGATIEQLKAHPDLISLHTTNLAGVRPPDAFPKLQRVVQHVSWAPVIVDLKWRK